jgi:ankyrin repeat protein
MISDISINGKLCMIVEFVTKSQTLLVYETLTSPAIPTLCKFGSTALLIAVTNGHGPVAAVLLDNGADVNHANTVSVLF